MEYERLIGYELTVARRFDRCLLISEKDRLAIDPNRELKNVFYNPHGTDVDLFAPPPNNKREPASVVFAGALSIDTNSDAVLFFVDKILPRIWRQRPDVRFYIVGKNPPASIIRLNKDPRIRVTGFLEDIRPYLWRCSVGVDPIRIAAGMQNKVIEGMAAGLPMVVSPEANEGIGAPEREALVVGKNPEDFATKVLTLINCPEVAQKLSITGRNYVKKYWSWEYHFRQLEGLFFELVTAYREGRKDVDCEKRSIRFALS
ncbi:MAG: glycosyltransferase [Syntrophaceae bacterium]|nr:glycosyltransferase [Syntrophaceae bacterium]